jgi:predicted AlkP superfamily phosphohydrolase/phosphomutase
MSLHIAQTNLLLLGLDGASPRLLNWLIAQGEMPYLRALTAGDSVRPLESVLPYATPAAWSTIYTGVDPGAHGVLDFTDWLNPAAPLADSASLRAPAIWQRLSEQGRRVAMIAFPLTYPPPVVNGVMVSGLPSPHRGATWAYPADFDGLLKSIEGFLPDPEMTSPWVKPEASIARLEQHVQAVAQAALAAHERYGQQGWDLFGVQFQALDTFQHMFWAWVDPEDVRHDKLPNAQKQRARAFFRVLDEAIHQLVDRLSPQEIVLLSDHGFGPAYEAVCLNHLLLDSGLLKLAVTPARLRAQLWAQRLLKRLDVFRLRARLKFSPRPNVAMRELSRWMRDDLIDRAGSPAVNLSGGYCGLVRVQPGFEDRIRAALLGAHHPVRRTSLIRSVQFPPDVWRGPCAAAWRSLAIVQPEEGYVIDSHLRPYGVVAPISAGLTGTHRPTGVLWTTLATLRSARTIQDIAPGILRALGIEPSASAAAPVAAPKQPTADYTAEDQRAIEERLRRLGYL